MNQFIELTDLNKLKNTYKQKKKLSLKINSKTK